MAKAIEAKHLPNIRKATPKVPVIGVFATSDPRIDKDSRIRCQNIVKMAADTISGAVVLPDKTPVPVVYSQRYSTTLGLGYAWSPPATRNGRTGLHPRQWRTKGVLVKSRPASPRPAPQFILCDSAPLRLENIHSDYMNKKWFKPTTKHQLTTTLAKPLPLS